MNFGMRTAALATCYGLALAGCSPSDQSSQTVDTVASSASSPPDPAELARQERPADQIELEKLFAAVQAAEQSSGNEINDKINFLNAYKKFCNKMQVNRVIENWTGVVEHISAGDPSAKGSGVDELSYPSISIVTGGGLAIFQYLNKDLKLLNAVKYIKDGEYVKFYANINHISKGGDGEFVYECDHNKYDDPTKGPWVNHMLVGDLTAVTPIS